MSASYVDGSDSTEGAYVPNLTNGDKAFALLFEPIEAAGGRDGRGHEVKSSATSATSAPRPEEQRRGHAHLRHARLGCGTGLAGRSRPPPWSQLASAGCGHIYGNVAASDKGGARTTIASVGPDNVTAGTVIDGHCFAVKDASASTTTVQVVPGRCRVDRGHELPDRHGLHEGDVGSGVLLGVRRTSTPVTTSSAPSAARSAPTTYALLIHRADRDAAQILKAAAATRSRFRPRPARSRPSRSPSCRDVDDLHRRPDRRRLERVRGMPGKPMYGSTCFDDIWPDPEITQRANFVWMDSTTRRTPHILGVLLQHRVRLPRHGEHGVEGVAGRTRRDPARHLQVHGPL